MNISPEELKRLMSEQRIPSPSEEGRKKSLEAAKTELRRQRLGGGGIKGTVEAERLTGRTKERRPAMRKLGYAFAGLALCGIGAAVVIPNFLNFRLKAKSSESKSNLGALRSTEIMHSGAPFSDDKAAAPPASTPSPALRGMSAERRYFGEFEEGARPLPQEYVGRDRFETVEPNPVKVAAEEPVSTFSVDVDTASYAFVRRALNGGHLPQKSAVRIEELINYFDYDYSLPESREAPFRPAVAVFPAPWNRETRVLRIGIKGYDIEPEKRPRANLVLLLDVSGSMDMPDKLPLLRNAFRMLVESLEPDDSVAIVVYAGSAGTVLEPTPARQKARILDALDRLRAGGSTAGGEGIRRAYALAEANFDPEGVNRVILATDGDFNVGIRDPEELKGFVERKRETGIFLSVLGFGQGNLNDALMQKLAQNGNGNAAYIDTLREARKVLVEEAGGTLFTIARDVKIQVEFNPARVAEYRLIGYETRMLRREDFNNDLVDAGDVGAGHTVTVLYEITPVGSEGRLIDDLRYRSSGDEKAAGDERTGEYAFLRIRYKLPGEERSRLIEQPIGPASEHASLDSAPGEARFAAAVAAFGQILRGDPYVKGFGYDDVTELARPARGDDPYGYRSEFLGLVRLARSARAMGER